MSKKKTSYLLPVIGIAAGIFLLRKKPVVSGIGLVDKFGKKPFNYINSEIVKKNLAKEIKDYKITDIFFIDSELYTTSYYDLPREVIKEIMFWMPTKPGENF